MSYSGVTFACGFAFSLFIPMMGTFDISSYLQILVWILSPATGFLEPFFGIWNDTHVLIKRVGRRRPVIFIAVFLIGISFVFLGLISRNVLPGRALNIFLGIFFFLFF